MKIVNRKLIEKADKDELDRTNESKCDKLDTENVINL